MKLQAVACAEKIDELKVVFCKGMYAMHQTLEMARKIHV